MSSPRVLIVEDEQIVALDLEDALRELGYLVVGIVQTGEHALKRVEEGGVDVILMDVTLAGVLDGVITAKSLRSAFSLPIVFLTAHTDAQTLNRIADVEAAGFIAKPFRRQDIASVLHIALRRPTGATPPEARPAPTTFVSTPVHIAVAATPDSTTTLPAAIERGLRELSTREREVLGHFMKGFSVSTIAGRLDISAHTVRNHLKGVFRKLQVDSQRELREKLVGVEPRAFESRPRR